MARVLAFSGLISVMLLGVVLQPATPPRPDDSHDSPTPEGPVIGCEGVPTYVDVLFDAFGEHETFADYWINGSRETADIQRMDVAEVEAIVEDGNAMLDDMERMEVPSTYVPGHEGIMVILDFQVRTLTFLAIDATDVPSQEEWERGLALILDGELRTANACPDEVDAAGGYIFFPPDDIQDVLA